MRWVWIGDSILGGMADTLASVFAARNDASFVHFNNGWAVWRWIREGAVPTMVRSELPDVVVIALGTNDEEEPKERFVRNVKDITAKGKLAGARVVWVGPFNSQERNDWGKSAGVGPWVDGMKLAEGMARTADGVHFLDYKELAARTLGAVEAALVQPVETPKSGVLWPLVLGVLAGGALVAGVWWAKRSKR